MRQQVGAPIIARTRLGTLADEMSRAVNEPRVANPSRTKLERRRDRVHRVPSGRVARSGAR